jgi:hypothetical protein
MTAHRMTGSWTIPVLLAGFALFGSPGPHAAAGPPGPPGATFQLAQADTTSSEDDEDDGEDVPIPANLLEDSPFPGSKDAPPDTTGAAAARDSTRTSIPAEAETLRYVQPGGPRASGTPATMGAKPGPAPPVATPPKPKGALFGLGPVVIILGIAVIHYLVLRTVGG